MIRRTPALLLAVGMAGCAPTLQVQPTPQVAAIEWSETLSLRGTPVDARLGLGRAFGSADLAALIDQALRRNPDIGIAAARIDQARALLRGARAAARPTVNLSAGAEAVSDRASARAAQGDAYVGLDVAYDLDLFGGAAAERRASRDRVRAAEEDRRAVSLVVEAEVARAFLQRAALAKRLALLDRNLAQATELERIIGARRAAGEATMVDVGRQRMQLRELQAERVRLDLALVQTRSALALLCGEEAPTFVAAIAELDGLAVPMFREEGPQALVGARPDVRAAEAMIAAAGGDIASARAAFYPRIRLSSGAFLQSAAGGPLASLLSIGSGVLAPIFNRGALHRDHDLATARQRESVEIYRRTLLTALSEVENARAATNRTLAREELVAQVVEEARRTARLTRLQFVEGEADLRDSLDAEERLIAAEDALALARQQRLEAAIDLFRATGGRLS
jgi:NodT family efflux transporter outer membrane factor (OMF) lipoprotein